MATPWYEECIVLPVASGPAWDGSLGKNLRDMSRRCLKAVGLRYFKVFMHRATYEAPGSAARC